MSSQNGLLWAISRRIDLAVAQVERISTGLDLLLAKSGDHLPALAAAARPTPRARSGAGGAGGPDQATRDEVGRRLAAQPRVPVPLPAGWVKVIIRVDYEAPGTRMLRGHMLHASEARLAVGSVLIAGQDDRIDVLVVQPDGGLACLHTAARGPEGSWLRDILGPLQTALDARPWVQGVPGAQGDARQAAGSPLPQEARRAEQVLDFLRARAPEAQTASAIARALGGRLQTIRAAVGYLVEHGVLQEVSVEVRAGYGRFRRVQAYQVAAGQEAAGPTSTPAAPAAPSAPAAAWRPTAHPTAHPTAAPRGPAGDPPANLPLLLRPSRDPAAAAPERATPVPPPQLGLPTLSAPPPPPLPTPTPPGPAPDEVPFQPLAVETTPAGEA